MKNTTSTLLNWIEFPVLLAGVIIAGGLWGFEELMEIARATTPHAFDTEILLAFRQAGHPDVPLGPLWLQGAMRDITSLGSSAVLTLVLYSLGNLVMLRLVREFGMSVSFSLSAVIQLVAVNVVALVFFGERVNALQATGIVLAIASVVLITLGPYLQGRL